MKDGFISANGQNQFIIEHGVFGGVVQLPGLSRREMIAWHINYIGSLVTVGKNAQAFRGNYVSFSRPSSF